MRQPDFEQARQYALDRLARQLSATLAYHSLAHTRDDVVPAVERFAAFEGRNGESVLLLRTAAYFHDIGFIVQREEHEALGAKIAEDVLPHFGYTDEQVHLIGGMILATRMPQAPHTPLEALLADADLDVLGREDFLERNSALRRENEIFSGETVSDADWYSGQIAFLSQHCYFSEAARTLRGPQKERNIALLFGLLEQCR